MFGEECTVAMRDYFHFESARFKCLDAEPLEHLRQNFRTFVRSSFFRSPRSLTLLERRMFRSTLAVSS